MIKIAFIGSDSTHTEAFGDILKSPDSPISKSAKVVSIWGEDSTQAHKKAKLLEIPKIALTVEDALIDVDLAMVITRFSDNHVELAEKALRKGVPTFIDKPFTTNVDEAKYLTKLAKDLSIPLCSFSPLRFSKEIIELKQLINKDKGKPFSVHGSVPANCSDLGDDPRLQSPLFYGIHGLEMLLELVGSNIKSVSYNYGNTSISVSIEMVSGNTVLFSLIRNTVEFYCVGVYTKSHAVSKNIKLDGSYYEDELNYLVNRFMFGHHTVSLESTLKAVEILETIRRNDTLRIN